MVLAARDARCRCASPAPPQYVSRAAGNQVEHRRPRQTRPCDPSSGGGSATIAGALLTTIAADDRSLRSLPRCARLAAEPRVRRRASGCGEGTPGACGFGFANEDASIIVLELSFAIAAGGCTLRGTHLELMVNHRMATGRRRQPQRENQYDDVESGRGGHIGCRNELYEAWD